MLLLGAVIQLNKPFVHPHHPLNPVAAYIYYAITYYYYHIYWCAVLVCRLDYMQ